MADDRRPTDADRAEAEAFSAWWRRVAIDAREDVISGLTQRQVAEMAFRAGIKAVGKTTGEPAHG